jgi:transposase
VAGLVSHKLLFSSSINCAAEWLNQPHIMNEFGLSENVAKTYYRVFETVGRHDLSIMTLLQNRLFELYDFKSTDANMDWSSIILHGCKANLGAYGYSRDHRPDKKQITFGVAQFRAPINIPFALSIGSGNVPDKVHFEKTYRRMLKALLPGSMIVIDRGANSKEIKESIRSNGHHYLCGASLSKAVDERIMKFDKGNAVLVEDKDGKKIFCQKYTEDGEFAFLYFSEKLHEDTISHKERNARKVVNESLELEKKITSGRKQRAKKHDLKAFVAELKLSFQQRLKPLTKEELVQHVLEKTITGREGFFLLKSSKDLTEKEALCYYRSRDTIEKLIDSLKNTIRIKPIRVWTDDAIKGALIIGFFAQLIIALMQFEQNLQRMHPRTLLNSLRNLTLTVQHCPDFAHKRIISNIDAINIGVFSIKTRVT